MTLFCKITAHLKFRKDRILTEEQRRCLSSSHSVAQKLGVMNRYFDKSLQMQAANTFCVAKTAPLFIPIDEKMTNFTDD